MAPRVDPLIGQEIGGFKLEHRIGEGAVGIVYAGRRENGRTAAVKVVRPELADDSRYALTVIAEARAVSTIGHPGIVNIFDLGLLSDGRPFVVMEFIDGQSLEDLLSHGPMEPTDVLEILEELFAALEAAHNKNVLHRDIKPANIYLTTDGQGRRVVKLLDFGLARLNFAPGSQASMVVGTPDYMAPEQASSKLTYASDLYAVGVVAFRMLTGQLPFIGQSTMEVIMAHVKRTPQKPSFLRPGLSPKIDALVLSLLEKSPSQRPSSAEVARMSVAAMRRGGALTVGAPNNPLSGDETFRPFVPKTPFVLQGDDGEDSGSVRRTEPFKPSLDAQGAGPDVTERQMSPFGGMPADSTLPPNTTEKPGNEHRSHAHLGPIPDEDDEATVTGAGGAAPTRLDVVDRPTELENETHREPVKKGSGGGMMWAVLAVLALGTGAASWWFFMHR